MYLKDKSNYSASFTCVDDDSPNAGYTVSAFAPMPDMALKVLLYKVHTALPPNWSDYEVGSRSEFG